MPRRIALLDRIAFYSAVATLEYKKTSKHIRLYFSIVPQLNLFSSEDERHQVAPFTVPASGLAEHNITHRTSYLYPLRFNELYSMP